VTILSVGQYRSRVEELRVKHYSFCTCVREAERQAARYGVGLFSMIPFSSAGLSLSARLEILEPLDRASGFLGTWLRTNDRSYPGAWCKEDPPLEYRDLHKELCGELENLRKALSSFESQLGYFMTGSAILDVSTYVISFYQYEEACARIQVLLNELLRSIP